jgi:hypothetical protein
VLSSGEFRNEYHENRNAIETPKITAVQVRSQPPTKDRYQKVVLKEKRKGHTHSQHLPKTTSLSHSPACPLCSRRALSNSILFLIVAASPTSCPPRSPFGRFRSPTTVSSTKSLIALFKTATHFHHFCPRCWFLFRCQICAIRP